MAIWFRLPNLAQEIETECDKARNLLDGPGPPRTLADVSTSNSMTDGGDYQDAGRGGTMRSCACLGTDRTPEQLDLVDEASAGAREPPTLEEAELVRARTHAGPLARCTRHRRHCLSWCPSTASRKIPGNPRTEFPEEEIAELAQDIALRGILQPIVVRRATR